MTLEFYFEPIKFDKKKPPESSGFFNIYLN